MKVRKAIKRIAAIGAGATMLGATLMGAMAADLSDYPNMFIKDGHFNGLLVVGENADAIDTIGMTNIALGLAGAAVTKTTVCGQGSSSTTTVSDGVKIDKSGTHMNYGNSIYDVTSTIDDSDLPNILADGTYSESEGNTDNNEDYTQVLNFVDGTGTISYTQDDDGAEDAGSYLQFVDTSGKYAYQYMLEFDTPIEYDTDSSTTESDDLESTSLTIQGQPYTITEAHFSSNIPDKLTLMAGQSMMWIGQGETVTKTLDGVDHTIKMIDVNNDADACGFEIDGSTVWIDKDNTETTNGVTLGVTDALAVYTEHYDGDMCKVFIGAEELVLEEGQEVEKAGTDVDGSDVSLSATSASTAGSWTGLTITWTPDDNTYLAPGDELVDPVFGNFKFVFGGVSKTTEDISFTASSSDAEFVFTNDDNKEVTIPIVYNESSTSQLLFGEDEDNKRMYYYGNNVCQDNDDVRDCEGSLWLAVDGHTAHVLKIADIDTTNDKIDFEDVTYDTTDTDNDYTNGSATDVYVSGLGTLSVNVDEANHRVTISDATLGDPTDIETNYGAMITTFSAAGNITIGVKENDDSAISSSGLTTFNVTYAYDSGSDETIEIKTPSMTAGNYFGGTGGFDESDSNNDDKRWATKYGSVVEYDSENEDELTIIHPDDWVQGDVYVAPTGAALSSTEQTAEGCTVSETPNPIPSTVNKFDSEVSDYKSNNIIAIGGPCANTVSAALLGNPKVCYEGFEEGKSLLQLFENGDNVALLVAGGTGKDTRAASKILQNYENYDLSGSKMEATTVSMTVKPWTETVVTTPAAGNETE